MREADELAGRDDVVFAGAQVCAGGIALSDERPDRVDEPAKHGGRLRRGGVAVDPGFRSAVGDVENGHLVRHGAGQVGDLVNRDTGAHPNPARAHAVD